MNALSIPIESLDKFVGRLRSATDGLGDTHPGDHRSRQPVHTVYGGAHLFRSDTVLKLSTLAQRALETYAPEAEAFAAALDLRTDVAGTIYERVRAKLETEAVEDLRIDFEDGYGFRPDAEEDGNAIAAAREAAKAMSNGALPPFFGIRIKSFSEEAARRAIRTLDLFVTAFIEASGGNLPENFVVTLPKIISPDQIAVLADIFDEIEPRLGIAPGTLELEMMIETPQSIFLADGSAAMPKMLAAARGRCTGAHFGAYDYTASLGITSAYQDMLHQACDLARNMMQISLAGTDVALSDGATNVMPVGPHRSDSLTDEQFAENKDVVYRAWRLHYDHCRHSLANGFYQGWDLHPAQLPTRYAAVYAFFLEGLDDAGARLRNFVEKAAQATLVGDVFDDAATGQGLLNFFVRGVACGAITEQEAETHSGLTLTELRSGSFKTILKNLGRT